MYLEVYEFAASAGAFEGYVYGKKEIDAAILNRWSDNLVSAYYHLPEEVRESFQHALDGTLGRALRSLLPLLGENHEIITKLKSIIKGDLPQSANDFEKKKWFQK